jgi:predicted DNA-binding transcriptional regulator AlpA
MIISGGEVARRAGVTKQAVYKFTREGKLPRIVLGSGQVGYDENDPVIQEYIESTSAHRRTSDAPGQGNASKPTSPAQPGHQKKALPEATPSLGKTSGGGRPATRNESGSPSRSDYELRKAKATAERIELNNRILSHQYVPCTDVRAVFGRIYSVHTSNLRCLDVKVADQIAAIFGSTDSAMILRCQKLISDEIYQALTQIKQQLNDYITQEGKKAVSESEELGVGEMGK